MSKWGALDLLKHIQGMNKGAGGGSAHSAEGGLVRGRTASGKVPAKTLRKMVRAGPPASRPAHPERVPLETLQPPVGPEGLNSTQACTGACCAPLHRNRSCARMLPNSVVLRRLRMVSRH